MLCQECHKREATLHLKKTINGVAKDFYLCEVCAAGKTPYHSHSPGHNIYNLHQLLSEMLELEEKSSKTGYQKRKGLQCPNCGMTYDQFASLSRFGCAECYGAFKEKIKPLFRKIHGSAEHSGKVPKRQSQEFSIHRKIKQLKTKLQQAVEQEAFEEAARLRDEIRALEKDA